MLQVNVDVVIMLSSINTLHETFSLKLLLEKVLVESVLKALSWRFTSKLVLILRGSGGGDDDR